VTSEIRSPERDTETVLRTRQEWLEARLADLARVNEILVEDGGGVDATVGARSRELLARLSLLSTASFERVAEATYFTPISECEVQLEWYVPPLYAEVEIRKDGTLLWLTATGSEFNQPTNVDSSDFIRAFREFWEQ
jgi:hypothetical protein